MLAKIFANPDLPEIDDYYEPFTFDYEHLQKAPELQALPTARPRSLITGERMEKIEWGPNWEEILGGEFAKRSQDYNFEGVQKEIYGQFENTFMMYLPRLCEHCLNPACVAACPSGAIYKREEDGIVLIDQDKCRGWRMCVSGCPYKKIYYNWSSGKSEKCIFCYPRIEAGQPTVCSETCVGRIRYLGVVLYDADRHRGGGERRGRAGPLPGAARHLPRSQRPRGDRAGARRRHAGRTGSRRPRRSPVWKMAMEWKVAFPLHPEYRTLPMVWYVPPLSPIQSAAEAGKIGQRRRDARRALAAHPAASTSPTCSPPATRSRSRWRSSACWPCAPTCGPRPSTACIDESIAEQVGLTGQQIEDMYQIMAIANYEDRFVIPTAHRELGEDAYDLRGSCGFSFGNGCSDGRTETNLFGAPKQQGQDPDGGRRDDAGRSRCSPRCSPIRPPSCRRQSPRDARGARRGEARLPQRNRDRLDRLLEEIATGDLYDLQERYVLLFDRTRSLSLHLFEHVHGESRDRGQAMVDLKALYETAWPVHRAPASCPIIVPLFLEFLSTQPPRPRRASCSAQTAHVLAAHPPSGCEKRKSAYSCGVLVRSVRWPQAKPQAEVVAALLSGAGRGPQRSRGARCRLGGGGGHASVPARGSAVRQGRPRRQDARRASASAWHAGARAQAPVVTYSRPTAPEESTMRDAINSHRVRLVSLPLPDRVPARQPAALRPRAIHLEDADRASCCAGAS